MSYKLAKRIATELHGDADALPVDGAIFASDHYAVFTDVEFKYVYTDEEDRALDAAGLKDITYQEFMKRADTARRLSEEQDMSDRAAKSFGRRPDKEEM